MSGAVAVAEPVEGGKGGKLYGGALTDEALDSSRSVLDTTHFGHTRGLQQFYTPREAAEFIKQVIDPLGRLPVLDPTAGNGALLAPWPSDQRFGVEIDGDQVKAGDYRAITGDVQRVFPMLRKLGVQFPQIVANPPFGLMTTLTVRASEQAIERRVTTLAAATGRDVGAQARTLAGDQIAERIGARLSDEQAHALEVITGPERAAILVGPAGTGKGVVIDAAARAEQHTGHQTLGIAVSGSTAQRLGQDSPALAGQTLTLDALVARVDRGQLHIDEHTTIYFDEAGMADTDRLDRLTEVVEREGSKLVTIGDAAQLPSIGAGGMFERLSNIAPFCGTVEHSPDP